MLLGAVALVVLLIACSNAASLMLARAVRRRREIAIRLALGVSRRRLAASFLTDAMLLATLGGVAAVAVSATGGAVMRDVLLDGIVWDGRLVDARTIVFIGLAVVIAGLITGAVPALVLLRRFDLSAAIGEGRQSGGVHRHRVISSLVVTQTVLSALLLIGAALFVRSLMHVRRVPLGVDLEHTVAVSFDASTLRASASRADALFAGLNASVARAPGVPSPAPSPRDCRSAGGIVHAIGVPGRSPIARHQTWCVHSRRIERVLRDDRHSDCRGASRSSSRTIAARVSASPSSTSPIAKALWPDGDVVGQCVRLGADTMPCRRIVGVAEGTQESVIEPNDTESPYAQIVYVPLSQGRHTVGARTLIARIDAPPATAIAQIRSAIQRVEPDLPLPDVWLMESRHDPELRPWRLGATMFGIFGALALVVAALGLYSVIGYSVSQRTGEMGIRIALGAQRRHIRSLVGKQGAVLAGIGVLIAIVGAVVLAPLVQPLLFQTQARSVAVYALVSFLVLAVAVLASLIPAERAARVSPMSVIRSE